MRNGNHRRLSFEPLEARKMLATLAINAGGPTIGDFQADQFFAGGSTFGPNNGSISPINLTGVTDPAPADVYRTERNGAGNGGAFSYTIPGLVAGNSYALRLHFAEIFFESSSARVFDVRVNGADPPLLDNYDVFVQSGDLGSAAEQAIVEEFTVTARTNGTLLLEFTSSQNNAKLSALELTGTFAADPDPPFEWTPAADAPFAVFEGQGAAVGDRLFLTGGYINNALDVTDQGYAYTPATNTWAAIADAPTQLTHGASVVDGDKIYVVGGFVGSNPGYSTTAVWVYDTALDEWSAGPNLPADRGGGGAAIVDRRLHFFAGASRPMGTSLLTDQPNHWVLDLGATDSQSDDATEWTMAADIPNPRNHMAGAAIDGLIYAVGGQHRNNEETGNQDDLHVYDPETNQWTQLADLPIPLGHIMASTVVIDGKLVVIAGVTQGRTKSDRVFSYDPFHNGWTELPSLPAPRQSPVAGVVGDQLIVSTGSNIGRQDDTWVASQPVALPGDYDGSGLVDQLDYFEWRAAFGATGTNPADGNGDGIVNLADYTVWRDNLGASRPNVDLTLPAANAALSTTNLQVAFATLPPASSVSLEGQRQSHIESALSTEPSDVLLLYHDYRVQYAVDRAIGELAASPLNAIPSDDSQVSEQAFDPNDDTVGVALVFEWY